MVGNETIVLIISKPLPAYCVSFIDGTGIIPSIAAIFPDLETVPSQVASHLYVVHQISCHGRFCGQITVLTLIYPRINMRCKAQSLCASHNDRLTMVSGFSWTQKAASEYHSCRRLKAIYAHRHTSCQITVSYVSISKVTVGLIPSTSFQLIKKHCMYVAQTVYENLGRHYFQKSPAQCFDFRLISSLKHLTRSSCRAYPSHLS